jgi:hypothetical protein
LYSLQNARIAGLRIFSRTDFSSPVQGAIARGAHGLALSQNRSGTFFGPSFCARLIAPHRAAIAKPQPRSHRSGYFAVKRLLDREAIA